MSIATAGRGEKTASMKNTKMRWCVGGVLFPASWPVGGGGLLLRNSHPFNLKGNALTISASAKRDHVFPDMIRDLIANTLRSVL